MRKCNETTSYLWCKERFPIPKKQKATDRNLWLRKDPLSSYPQNIGTIWVGKDAVIGEHQIRVTLSCNNNDRWEYFTGTGKFYVTDWWTEFWIKYSNLITVIGMLFAAIIGAIVGGKYTYKAQLQLKIMEEHTDRLREIIKKWRDEMIVPDYTKYNIYEMGDISFDEPNKLKYIESKEFRFNFEDALRFEDLRKNHIPSIKEFSDLYVGWVEFKDELKSYYDKCRNLFNEIQEDSIQKTGLPLRNFAEILDTKEAIDEGFSRFIYDSVLYRVEKSEDYRQNVRVNGSGEIYDLSVGGSITIAKGNKKEMDNCAILLSQMQKSDNYLKKAKGIIKSKQELEDLKEEINEKLEKLILIQRLPGECEYIKLSKKSLGGSTIGRIINPIVKRIIR